MKRQHQFSATVLVGLVVVFVLGIGVTVYHLVSIQRLEVSVEETQYQLLSSIRQAVDTQLRAVDNALLTLAFNEFTTSYMGPQAESEFTVIDSMQGVQRQLFGIRAINEGVLSVWAIAFSRGQVLSDTSSSPLDGFSDEAWVAGATFAPRDFRIVERRVLVHPRDVSPPETSTVVTIARSFPVLASSRPYQRGLLVANVDVAHLASLCSVESGHAGLFVVVTNANGEAVLTSPSVDPDLDIAAVVASARSLGQRDDAPVTLNGDEVQVIHQVSSFNDWTYTLVVPGSYLRNQTRIITTTQIGVLVLLCIAGVALTAIAMRWSFRPVNRFVDSVDSHLSGAAASDAGGDAEASSAGTVAGEPQVASDEFGRIESAVVRVLQDNASMKQRIEQHAPAVRWGMLMELLMTGTKSMDWSKQQAALRDLGVEFYSAAFLVFVIDPDDDEVRASDETRAAICDLATQTALNVGRGVAVETWNSRVALIVSFRDAPDDDSVLGLAMAEELTGSIRQRLGVTASVGVSATHRRPDGIADGYREALHALDHRIVLGPGAIVVYDEVETSFDSDVSVLYADIERVLRVVTGRSAREVESTVREWFGRGIERGASLVTLQRLAVHLLMAAAGRAAEAGIDLRTHATPLHADSPDELVNEVVTRLTAIVAAYDATRSVGRSEVSVEQAMSIVRSRFSDSTLSLSSVAAEIGMSQSHLSRVFHEVTGTRFVDFLIGTRIEHAKELLRGEGSVQAVARAVGYGNSHSFLRIFKRSTGMTPSEFRQKLHTNGRPQER